jgi:hypothetical protein
MSEIGALQHRAMSEINKDSCRRYQYGENAGEHCALRDAGGSDGSAATLIAAPNGRCMQL